VTVYRPGLITGHSQTGAWNTEDVTSRMIKSWVEVQYAPDLEAATDMTPVDYVSRAVAHLSRSPASLGGTLHLANPEMVDIRDLVAWLQDFGYPVEAVGYQDWRARLVALARQSQGNATHSLAPLFSITLSEDAPRAELHRDNTLDGLGALIVSQFANMSARFDCQNALAGLDGSGITCPPVDAGVFANYLSYFVDSGFLQPPPPEQTGDGSH
jgi:thioester reductase-like protein